MDFLNHGFKPGFSPLFFTVYSYLLWKYIRGCVILQKYVRGCMNLKKYKSQGKAVE
jgi:hypothetical protein